jgi:hypothetical protein
MAIFITNPTLSCSTPPHPSRTQCLAGHNTQRCVSPAQSSASILNGEQDSTRLPEGMKRIGYDADTARYTFCDQHGNIYLGPPHEEYGLLTAVAKSSRPSSSTDDRPQAFASGLCHFYNRVKSLLTCIRFLAEKSKPDLSVNILPPGSGQTFYDILPAHLITSPSSADSRLSPSPRAGESSPAGRFRDAVRRAATMPSMQNVVNNVRRSATSARKPRDHEKTGLLRSDSKASSNLTRSNTSTTASTLVSFQSIDEKH